MSTDITALSDSSETGTECQYNPPTVRFERLTFSDGTTVKIDPADIVVLVGPNNAGKSVALRELQSYVGRGSRYQVIVSTDLIRTGTPDDFLEYLERHVSLTQEGGSTNIRGPGINIGIGGRDVKSMWPDQIDHFAPLFCVRISTEMRITDSDPAPTFAVLEEVPSNPIHLLFTDDELERRISQYFHRAFGKDLIVFRLGGSSIPLLVGEHPDPVKDEDRLSKSYNERLHASAVALHEQGDGMRSFASVILHLLAPTTPSVLLLDEPEAFLHPPQARLLGEIIAQEKPWDAQLFVATHSPDVLRGLINVAPENLRVLRMQRGGDLNRVRELDKDLVREISLDPLMVQSSIMSGIFHERVIICESDADCMFYGSLLNLREVHGDRYPDVLLVHANGKHRMRTLARVLIELDVPVDVIADIDVLNDMGVFKGLVEALGGDWESVAALAQAVKSSIEQHKPWLNAAEIKKGIMSVLDQVPSVGTFPKELKSEIDSQFRKASPWDAVKSSGASAIPPGQPTQQFHELLSRCRAMGMWIVPVGEMEGFCRSVGGHGPSWVQQVFGDRDLESDNELAAAREFVHELWSARQHT